MLSEAFVALGFRLAKTLDKVDALEKQFAGADGSERKAFSRGAKVDPQVVLGLAEQRVEKLLTKFAADRTVRPSMLGLAAPVGRCSLQLRQCTACIGETSGRCCALSVSAGEVLDMFPGQGSVEWQQGCLKLYYEHRH